MWGWSCKNYRKKVEMKAQKKTNLVQKDLEKGDKKRTLQLLHLPSSAWNKSRVL